MAVLYVPHFTQFFDNNGDPLAGGKLYTYDAGTTTPRATYTTAAGTVANANPVVLDSSGRATVFLSGSYKFVLKDSADNPIVTTDNITAFAAGGAVDFSTLDTVTAVSGDYGLISDTSDSGNTRKALLSDYGAFPGVSRTFTAQQAFNNGNLSDGATISWDLNEKQSSQVTLGGNRTLANPTNMIANTTYILIVKQDGTGSRTLSYGSAYKWPAGVAPTLTTTANGVDILSFVSDGTNMYGTIQKAFG